MYDIHILGSVCPPDGEKEGGGRRQKAGEGRRARGEEGECGRGWLPALAVVVVGVMVVVVIVAVAVVVVGRASKAVVQTSGTMEATLVFQPYSQAGRRFCCRWCWVLGVGAGAGACRCRRCRRCWLVHTASRRMVITHEGGTSEEDEGKRDAKRWAEGADTTLWIFLIPAHVTL